MMQIQQGMVGVFDVLGYRALIYGNETRAVAEIITKIFKCLPEVTTSGILTPLDSPETVQWVGERIGRIDVRLFSDNILLTLPLNTMEVDASVDIPHFLAYAAKLMRVAFDNGLPLRGAISHGEYFLAEQCFAGKTILDCHEGAEDLQLAGCVVMPDTANYFEKVARNTDTDLRFHQFIFPFVVPVRTGQSIELPVLDWYLPMEDWGAHQEDIHAYIINAFQAHSKVITPKELSKIDNTELMMRKSIQRKQQ